MLPTAKEIKKYLAASEWAAGASLFCPDLDNEFSRVAGKNKAGYGDVLANDEAHTGLESHVTKTTTVRVPQ